MDIDETSGSRVPDVIHPPTTSEALPVEEKARLRRIRERTSQYEDLDRWIMEDKVTISPEARRKYRQMMDAKQGNPSEQLS
jgi:hypothetical protein